MLRVCTLYSGSSANCTLIEADGRAVLIDIGGGVRKTSKALSQLGLSFENIDAVFITHEHSDHTAGLETVCKYYHMPVIGNRRTLEAIQRQNHEIDDTHFCAMATGGKAKKDDFEITSFAAPHDSVECVGYRVTTKYGSVGVMTDAGQETDTSFQALEGCKITVLEANHDRDMLLNGTYPYLLKQRIIGPNGHLSNDQSASLLSKLICGGTTKVLLAHLSKENNTPETAMTTVTGKLITDGIQNGRDVEISVAPRDCISVMHTLSF